MRLRIMQTLDGRPFGSLFCFSASVAAAKATASTHKALRAAMLVTQGSKIHLKSNASGRRPSYFEAQALALAERRRSPTSVKERRISQVLPERYSGQHENLRGLR